MKLKEIDGLITNIIYMDNGNSSPFPFGYRKIDSKNKNHYVDVCIPNKMESFLDIAKNKDLPIITITPDGLSEEEKELTKQGQIIFLYENSDIKRIYKITGNKKLLNDLDICCGNFHVLINGCNLYAQLSIYSISDISYEINTINDKNTVSCIFVAKSLLTIDRIDKILQENPYLKTFVDIDTYDEDTTTLIITVSNTQNIELSNNKLMQSMIPKNLNLLKAHNYSLPKSMSYFYIACAADGRITESFLPSYMFEKDIIPIKKSVIEYLTKVADKTALSLFISTKDLDEICFNFTEETFYASLCIEMSGSNLTSSELSKNFWDNVNSEEINKGLHNELFARTKNYSDYDCTELSLISLKNKLILQMRVETKELPF